MVRQIRYVLGMTDEDALKLLKGEVQDAQEASDASVSMGTVLTTISEGTRMAMRAPFKKFVRKVQDLNWLYLRLFWEILFRKNTFDFRNFCR